MGLENEDKYCFFFFFWREREDKTMEAEEEEGGVKEREGRKDVVVIGKINPNKVCVMGIKNDI